MSDLASVGEVESRRAAVAAGLDLAVAAYPTAFEADERRLADAVLEIMRMRRGLDTVPAALGLPRPWRQLRQEGGCPAESGIALIARVTAALWRTVTENRASARRQAAMMSWL
jgi:hypothetical protein